MSAATALIRVTKFRRENNSGSSDACSGNSRWRKYRNSGISASVSRLRRGQKANKPRLYRLLKSRLLYYPRELRTRKVGSFLIRVTCSEEPDGVTPQVNNPDTHYTSRQAAYDIKKLRGKELVCLIKNSRRYEATHDGLRMITAFLVLREKVLAPLLASACKFNSGPNPQNQSRIDTYYRNIQIQMQNIFKVVGIAA